VKDCCDIQEVPRQQRRVLYVVLWINVAMFLIEAAAGLLARSTALLADSVDMLGDAIVYSFSLYVIGRGTIWQARAALLKGGIMAIFGIGVLLAGC
jgi:Co/Zn/Cd efflux system component